MTWRTKLHVEEMLADLCRAEPAWRVACLRYFNPAGAHPSGLIGEDPNGVPFLQREAGWHAINLGTGQGYSALEMLRAFEQACGHPLPHEFKARRPGDVASCYADPAKAQAVLGWRATRGIEEMCESTWRWCRLHLSLRARPAIQEVLDAPGSSPGQAPSSPA